VAIRPWLVGILILTIFTTLPLPVLAQLARGPHDMTYTSPTWGYSVRWHADEWAVDEDTSEDGVDSLWLSDAVGNIVGFDGRPGYGGDAAVCLEEFIGIVEEIPGASDIEVVFDEADAMQASWDPRWSWIILLARLPAGDQQIDYVVYLDCRTLAPGTAVLTRMLAAPTSTFDASIERFAVLQAVLPRGAYQLEPQSGWLIDGVAPGIEASLFFDQVCGGFPGSGRLLFGPDGGERAMLTIVDGPTVLGAIDESSDTVRVLRIENSGPTPLSIDPTGFIYADGIPGIDVMQDVAWASAVWEDTGETSVRRLPPGAWATVHVAWPDDVPFPPGGVVLYYRDDELSDGEVQVISIGVPGGCGGGSRPKLRIGR
jgi:hypothetical protein